ncbi:hypothetical protein [Neptunicella marina]|uniref:Uncharacterized protein n=1 Tax=Neptunicella marina TaxID=2125989 RepID=A0A8J6IYL5_9ALTE|nr:hypothetical protein [Neptunicella marina]MBC3767463.1 hypothetical protein [Neptunicella marina]
MSVELSLAVSSEDWDSFKDGKDKTSILTFLRHRYEERYFEPFSCNDSKHGFSMMAISCLMIESFVSLENGWKKTNKPGSEVFESFFSNSKYLKEFTGIGGEFYKNIRCGILHQAETTGGWRIRRDHGLPLLCKTNKIIHATKFINALKKEFDYFLETLEGLDFDSPNWKKVVKKIDYIVSNCS